MIYIEYAKHGAAISDFDYEEWIDRIKTCLEMMKKVTYSMGHDIKFMVSTSVPISAVRLAICKGEINHAHIAFIYKNKIFQADKNGRIENWPDGFADKEGDFAEALLTHQVKKKHNKDKDNINA